MKLPNFGSTSPDPIKPDLGPGAGQARDDALAAEARGCTNTRDVGPDPAAGSDSGAQAADDLDASIEAARVDVRLAPLIAEGSRACLTCGGSGWVPVRGDAFRPGVLGFDLCASCGGRKASDR
jgi:hypothetical protein